MQRCISKMILFIKSYRIPIREARARSNRTNGKQMNCFVFNPLLEINELIEWDVDCLGIGANEIRCIFSLIR